MSAFGVPQHRHVRVMPQASGGPQGGWWCSLVDERGKFVGVVVIPGQTDGDQEQQVAGVLTELNRIAPGEAGGAVLIRYSEAEMRRVPTGRLLGRADLRAAGENDLDCVELGIDLSGPCVR